jgi:hypothetical protein
MNACEREVFDRVEILDTGELLVGLSGAGSPAYQHVYRAAAGVYWDPGLNGFKSTPIREWSVPRWFSHLVSVVRSEIGVELVPADAIRWGRLSEQDKLDIERTAWPAQ